MLKKEELMENVGNTELQVVGTSTGLVANEVHKTLLVIAEVLIDIRDTLILRMENCGK